MALTGPELLTKIKELGNVSKKEVCRATGYIKTKEDGTESFLFNSFYQATLEASTGVKISSSSGTSTGKAGRAPTYVAKISPKGTVLVGSHYIEEAGGSPADEMEIIVDKEAGTVLLKLPPMLDEGEEAEETEEAEGAA